MSPKKIGELNKLREPHKCW